MTQLINRQYYTEIITPFTNKNIIKVLTGQRRVGKSCILQQLRQQILESVPNANIIFINKEYDEFSAIRTSEDLCLLYQSGHKQCQTFVWIIYT